MSRREALETGVALGGGLAVASLLGGVARGADDAPKSKAESAGLAPIETGAIDAHVHVWTPDVEKYPLASGFSLKDMAPASFTPEELFEHARPCGVARITLIQMSFYRFDNSYMLDTMRKYPGVFSGVAVIDENDPHPESKMKELKRQGVRGFRLFPAQRKAETFFSAAGMDAMWKAGAAEGLAMCLLINPRDLPFANKMCQKFPDTTVVIDHFARIGVDGRLPDDELANLCKLADLKNTYVKVSAFYALGRKKAPYSDLAPMVRKLLDAFGPERLMWATDCPYQVQEGHTYEDSIRFVREGLDFLSDGDRDWILRKTAEKVYFS